MDATAVEIHEVGPREGMQFEGIGDPTRIATKDKIRLVDALGMTGLRKIQVTSFVSPRAVPQMADADEVARAFTPVPAIEYDAVYLNDKGIERAVATGRLTLTGQITLTASETFSVRNQRRDLEQDIVMQRRMMAVFHRLGVPITQGVIMAAFGCNYEGDIPLSRVLEMVGTIVELAEEHGETVEELMLADTMGWADPEQVKRTIGAVRERWPGLSISLHLHDTRGTAMANVYAALELGVRRFDTSIGGLGGCPFAKSVAGNVPTEDLVFMCERMGLDTGCSLDALVECVAVAEDIVGHRLPSRVGHASLSA
jgi:hydroxymethylglutaryl-CoA lyase